MRFLRERRIPCSVDNDACDRAYAQAWVHLEQRPMLERSAPYSYWREEVHTVIRGRDLRDLDEYLVLDRVGRGSRLGHVQRRAVWHCHSKALTQAQVEQVFSALLVALPPADSPSAPPSRTSQPCEPMPGPKHHRRRAPGRSFQC